MGCFWPSKRRREPPRKFNAPDDPWPTVNGDGRAIHSAASSSGSSGAEDQVPALLSSGLTQLPAHCRRFRYKDLDVATESFAEDRVIGEGGFGKVYRGRLRDGTPVAIKRLDRKGMQGDKEFGMEASMLSTLRHPNIITLRGVCMEGDHRCTVFDLAINGSLRGQLDMKQEGLNWAQRVHVALGAACGLAYLHDEAEPPVVHRDFKTSNILVDGNCSAQVADFGLARRMKSRGGAGCHEPLPPECTVVMGTFGYVAPEYARTGTLNEKSDVYAYGVVLLELLTGAEVVDAQRPLANRNLVDWLYSKLHDIAQVKEVLDSSLGELSDAELATFCELAAACLQHDGWRRPRMTEAVAVLEQISACHTDDSLQGNSAPNTPRQSPTNSRPAGRPAPITSNEEHHRRGSSSSGASGPANSVSNPLNSNSPTAFKSLSQEATIVCLDGGAPSGDAAAVRDPFAASFVGFDLQSAHVPEQRGYSNNSGGDNPFAGLSSNSGDTPGSAGSSPGPGLRVATKPPLGPSRFGGQANGGGAGHNRAGSFSESLDMLAAKLGLSGPIGPNGQPVFAGSVAAVAAQLQQAQAAQAAQAQEQPPPQREWTVTDMAWNLPAHPAQAPLQPQPQHQQQQLPPRASPQHNLQPSLQQSPQRPPQPDVEQQASVQYIQNMPANQGTAFVSSTSEWRRRNLTPAAPPVQNGRIGQPLVPLLRPAPPQQQPFSAWTPAPRPPPTNGRLPPAHVQPSSPPWLQKQQQQPYMPGRDPFAPSAPLAPAASSNPFHSSEPCMICGEETREWHLAPCGHAIGCKPHVLRIARVGEPCPICQVPATGMLHQRFVHAAPVTSSAPSPVSYV